MGSPHSGGSMIYVAPMLGNVSLTAGDGITLDTQSTIKFIQEQEEVQNRKSLQTNLEEVSINIQDITVPSAAIINKAQVIESTTITTQGTSSPMMVAAVMSLSEGGSGKANGANFGGGASGGGGTGVSGLNGKNEYQTLILDGSKNLNINKRYLNILYGNDTPYWDEDYSIPLVSFDIGTLIYNGITLDDTYELENGIDYQEFIYNVTFPTLDPEYVYRLELNNGAVFLWAKLPDLPIPEPKTGILVLMATFFAIKRKRA